MASHKTLSDLPDRTAVRIAKTNLSACGCLSTWEQFMHLSSEGKCMELDIIRLGYCIGEQCWDSRDIDFVLSESDRSAPFPKSVRRCLINKLKNARSLKQEALERVKKKQCMLVERHRSCHSQAK